MRPQDGAGPGAGMPARRVQLAADPWTVLDEGKVEGPKGPKLLAWRAQDWLAGCSPKPISLGTLKHQLKGGLEVTRNLVELCTCAEVQELQNLWKVVGVVSPLTAVLTGQALKTTGTFLTRACLTREKMKACWEDVGLLQVSLVKGPWNLPVKSVKAATVRKPSKETATKKTLVLRLSRRSRRRQESQCQTCWAVSGRSHRTPSVVLWWDTFVSNRRSPLSSEPNV